MPPSSALDAIPPLAAIEAELARRARNKIATYFPETGPLRRELYAKHLAFFAAGGRHKPMHGCPEDCDGKGHRERCFMAGNRTGKSEAGAYETTLHLTGRYPDWWTGRRFREPIGAWACGMTNIKTRDSVQEKLLGKIVRTENDKPGEVVGLGTGMIPGDLIRAVKSKGSIPNAIDTVYVRHTRGTSVLTFKSYEQGREGFESEAKELIWLDEECPQDIYHECCVRTMTCDGMILLTFTPLNGLSEVVLLYLPGGKLAERKDQSNG